MNINDLQNYKQIIIDNFRSIKLDKDYAQFQLIQFQLTDLISCCENIIDLQKEIQTKHYQTHKQLEALDLIEGYDYVRWHHERCEEISLWKKELDLLSDYRYQIKCIIEDIENGTAEEMLIKQEKKLFE